MDPELEDTIWRLHARYHDANGAKFDRLLPARYRIQFNAHLRRLTGRITYAERLIEISLFHFRHYGFEDAVATLEHEMLHLYLHTLGLPSGHNARFKEMARTLEIRVFHNNPYPQNRSTRHRYLYECPSCRRMVFRKRRQDHGIACGVCCRQLAGGAWDPRFQLKLVEKVKLA
ncbi:MAG: SprT-like domain-containing protein [Polyangia bacterium]|jgi:predicted SprT family Zn-dependent metalloprotease